MSSVEEKIANHVAEWKKLGRILDIRESRLNQIDNDYNNTIEKALQCMLLNKQCTSNDVYERWSFWRKYLSEFDDGKRAIRELEMNDDILAFSKEATSEINHWVIDDSMGYLFHQYNNMDQREKLPVDFNRKVEVNVGSGDHKIVHFQEFNSLLQSRKEYFDTYTMFSDKNVFNFLPSDQPCKILGTFDKYFTEQQCRGFAVKGFSPRNCYSLFGTEISPIDSSLADRILVYFAEQNILMHVIQCDEQQIKTAIHEASKQTPFILSTFDFLENSNVIHIGVVLCRDKIDHGNIYCNTCFEFGLIVSKKTFCNLALFSEWFDSHVVNSNYFKNLKRQIPTVSEEKNKGDMMKLLKETIVAYQAVSDDRFPTFAKGVEENMDQAKKLIFLTPDQSEILLQANNHVIITGGYGSGKSFIIQKKFEQVCESLTNDGILILLCHDHQSKFALQMKYIKNKYPDKNVLLCNSRKICEETTRVSSVMKHLKKVWVNKQVHLFIDELNGSCLDDEEINEIKIELENDFKHSLVYIAFQSMTFINKHVESDANFSNKNQAVDGVDPSRKLEDRTSFAVYNLKYTMRNSKEIHALLVSTVQMLEKAELFLQYRSRDNSIIKSHNAILDREHGLQHAPKNTSASVVSQYLYNDMKKIGHDIHSQKPMLFQLDISMVVNDNTRRNGLYAIIKNIVQANGKCVIITYNEDCYDDVIAILSSTGEIWTNSIRRFNSKASKYRILVTDSASIRGFEYKNIIIVMCLDEEYLKYRLVETLSRATINLFVLALPTEFNDVTLEHILSNWIQKELVVYTTLFLDENNGMGFFNHPIVDSFKGFENLNLEFSPTNTEYPWRRASEQQSHENFTYQDLRNAFYVVCENDDVNLFKELISTHKIDVNQYRYRYYEPSLLYPATRCNSVKIIEVLLDIYKFNVDGRSSETPVHNAAKRNKNEAMLLLLSRGGDPNMRILDNETPLHWASRSNSVDVARTLLQHGADPNSRDDNDDTPIHNAASYNNKTIIKLLLEYGADINSRNKDGRCALHNACYSNSHSATSFLIKNGGNAYAIDYWGNTPLHMAVERSNKFAVEMLLKNSATINDGNNYGNTVLHEAVRQKNINIFKAILKKVEDVNKQNSKGETCLHEAVIIGNTHMIIDLINKGGRLDIYNENGLSPVDLSRSHTLKLFLQNLQTYIII